MKDTKKKCPEMTDREVIQMLAKIFNVGYNLDTDPEKSSQEKDY